MTILPRNRRIISCDATTNLEDSPLGVLDFTYKKLLIEKCLEFPLSSAINLLIRFP